MPRAARMTMQYSHVTLSTRFYDVVRESALQPVVYALVGRAVRMATRALALLLASRSIRCLAVWNCTDCSDQGACRPKADVEVQRYCYQVH